MSETVPGFVARTRAEQGLPPKVADPVVLARIADLMRDRTTEKVASHPVSRLELIVQIGEALG